MRWITKWWWEYLLEKPCNWTKFWCRAGGHKCGPWWFCSTGTEPDMRCKNCNDYID